MEWFVTGDYTYWTAREESLEFALTSTSQPTNANSNTGRGKVYTPGRGWDSGFKVGLGTVLCHDGWDLYAEYTWFNSNNSKHTRNGFTVDPTLLDIYWVINDENDLHDSASAKWHLKLNVVDLEMGRNFYVSRRLMLRPFYGLKGAWLNQKMNVRFTSPTDVYKTRNKISNWGIGVRGGLDTSWHFTRNFSILGDMAFTGLWEHFKVTRFDTDTTLATANVASGINFEEKAYFMKPIIEWSLGLKWETGIRCDRYHFSVSAAWEEQYWFGQNKFFRTPKNAFGTGADLTLQGLTIDLRFDF